MRIYNNYRNEFLTLPDLRLGNIPKDIEFADEKFVIKQEFHITLLAVEQIAQIIDAKNVDNLKSELVGEFERFTDKTKLTNYQISSELRLVDDGKNKSIIVMASLENIDKFFQYLSEKYGVDLPVQPTHITLYTLPTDQFGIPILSYQELAEISNKIDDKELPEVRNNLLTNNKLEKLG